MGAPHGPDSTTHLHLAAKGALRVRTTLLRRLPAAARRQDWATRVKSPLRFTSKFLSVVGNAVAVLQPERRGSRDDRRAQALFQRQPWELRDFCFLLPTTHDFTHHTIAGHQPIPIAIDRDSFRLRLEFRRGNSRPLASLYASSTPCNRKHNRDNGRGGQCTRRCRCF